MRRVPTVREVHAGTEEHELLNSASASALDRIYAATRERSLLERMRLSIGLAVAVAVLLLLALAVVHLGPLLVSAEGGLSVVSVVVRWTVAALLLLLAVGLTIHYAPATPPPLGWLSFGSVTAVVAWLIGSLLFVLYITEVAAYGSLFGSLATIFVLLTYLYTSAIALLSGARAAA